MASHKNALDERPAHGRAFHPQRGVREMRHLKSGWRWLTDDEVIAYETDGTTPLVRRLAKPGVRVRTL